MAIGCIQAQKCHTDHCPVGVATQNPRLHPRPGPDAEERAAGQLRQTLRRDLLKVSEAVGVVHPALISADDVDVVDGLTEPERCARSTATSPAGASLGTSTCRRRSST